MELLAIKEDPEGKALNGEIREIMGRGVQSTGPPWSCQLSPDVFKKSVPFMPTEEGHHTAGEQQCQSVMHLTSFAQHAVVTRPKLCNAANASVHVLHSCQCFLQLFVHTLPVQQMYLLLHLQDKNIV